MLNELQFGDGLRLSPGLRVESIRTELTDRGGNGGLVENDALVFVPGVGAWVSLGEHWGLLGGVHQGFSPLAPGSNAQAKPEKSTNYEVGTRWQYSKVRGELIGFFNDYNNLVGTCTQSAGCAEEDIDEQFNAGRAHILGAEAVIGTATGLGFGYALNVDVTYTWTKARFKSDFDSSFSQWGSVKEGDILPYVPEHQASVRVGVQDKTTGVTVTTTHVGEMRMLQVKEKRMQLSSSSRTPLWIWPHFIDPRQRGACISPSIICSPKTTWSHAVHSVPGLANAFSLIWATSTLSRPGRSSSSTAPRDPRCKHWMC